jgi:hypothetical protein
VLSETFSRKKLNMSEKSSASTFKGDFLLEMVKILVKMHQDKFTNTYKVIVVNTEGRKVTNPPVLTTYQGFKGNLNFEKAEGLEISGETLFLDLLEKYEGIRQEIVIVSRAKGSGCDFVIYDVEEIKTFCL